MYDNRPIIIGQEDLKRLEIFLANDVAASNEKSHLQSLRRKLDTATIVEPDEIPSDAVTLDSTVRLCDSRSSYEDLHTLVIPEEAAIEGDHLSILAPIGIAIFGCYVGDNVRWLVRAGTVQIHIKDVLYQPERDGVVP